MKNGLIEQEDLNFLLYDWLNIEDFLIKNNSEIDRETIDAFFDLSHKLARDHFLPHFKKSDQIEPYLEDGQVRVLKEIAQAKLEDLNANDIEGAMKIIMGSARSMGIEVKG